ncbi:flagellar basal body-associated FliL family protein [Motilibacter aurantiacus]|uniref:flagellar basal body-associated FliL family protein n=1 Tax=Motilibacter aurantiacus TaxID=2714955 RepID=UPI00140E3896|nr:flagellar basal body-associated FliL family protein [Motilibacter aurantiacus]NHC47109.1 hypothetical protein [Motilibacter aurantiacus]
MAKDKAAETAEDAPAKGGKKKMIIIAAVALVALLGGVYKFVLAKPAEAEAKEPEPGITLTLDPININLADGHFLKLGISLLFTVEGSTGHGEPEGSAALDDAISLFSGEEVSVLSVPKNREKLKKELLEMVNEDYHHGVMKVYFTNFVMQ